MIYNMFRFKVLDNINKVCKILGKHVFIEQTLLLFKCKIYFILFIYHFLNFIYI